MNELQVGTVVRFRSEAKPRYGLIAASSEEELTVRLLDGREEALPPVLSDSLSPMPPEGLISLFFRHERAEGPIRKLGTKELARATMLDLGLRATARDANMHLQSLFSGQALKLMKANLRDGLELLVREGELLHDAGSGEFVAPSVEEGAGVPEPRRTGPTEGSGADRGTTDPSSQAEATGHAPPDSRRDHFEAELEDERPAASRQRSLQEIVREIAALDRRLPKVLQELNQLAPPYTQVTDLPDEDVLAIVRRGGGMDGLGDLQHACARALLARPQLLTKVSGDLSRAVAIVATQDGLQELAVTVCGTCLQEIGKAKSIWRSMCRCLSTQPDLPRSSDTALAVITAFVSGRAALGQGTERQEQLLDWVTFVLQTGDGISPAAVMDVLAEQAVEAPLTLPVRTVLNALINTSDLPNTSKAARNAGQACLPLYEWLLGQFPTAGTAPGLTGEFLEAIASSQTDHARRAIRRLMEAADPLSRSALVSALELVDDEASPLSAEQRLVLAQDAVAWAERSRPERSQFIRDLIRASSQSGATQATAEMAESVRQAEQQRDDALEQANRAEAEVRKLKGALGVLQTQVEEAQTRDADSARQRAVKMSVELVDLLDAVLAAGHEDPALSRLSQSAVALLEEHGVRSDTPPGRAPSGTWVEQGMYRPATDTETGRETVVTRRAFAVSRAGENLLCVREGWLGVTRHASAERRD